LSPSRREGAPPAGGYPDVGVAKPPHTNRIEAVRQMRTPSALRSTAVLGLAAFCLHQLVYLIGFGTGAGHALEGRGHGYLIVVGPLLAVLALCAIVASLLAAARHGKGPVPGRRVGGWLFWTVLLLSIFSAQEAAEALLGTGNLDQLLSLVHHAGAAALLAAIAVGRLVTIALSGLDTLEATLTTPRPARRRAPAALQAAPSRAPLHFPQLNLAFGFARRPPPSPAA
jgi:hypothetical protein